MGQTSLGIVNQTAGTVYPHLRGADYLTLRRQQYTTGVSPPAWGRHTAPDHGSNTYRCIPTCVGQTQDGRILYGYLKVYPHLRGADDPASQGDDESAGVSPPAWGRRTGRCGFEACKRCIPTCVGQTPVDHPQNGPPTVYPHLRGADTGSVAGIMQDPGVSPPAWGRRDHQPGQQTQARCIPTCVGQTELS